MSDREMRSLLEEVIDEIDSGRLRIKRPRMEGLLRFMAPPLLAASLGLAGCDGRAVGNQPDATPDAALEDAGPAMDATYMAPPFDADIDAEILPPYMGPPFDAGPEPEYAGPFDAAVDEDGGPIPLYMSPLPESP